MGILSNIIGGGVSSVVDSVAKTVDRFVTTDDERAKIKMELRRIEAREKEKLLIATHSVIKAEAKSDDPWVRRARPTFLYVMYFILVFNFILVPILHMGVELWGATPFTPLAIPDELYWLFGSCMLGYTGARTWDKHISARSPAAADEYSPLAAHRQPIYNDHDRRRHRRDRLPDATA